MEIIQIILVLLLFICNIYMVCIAIFQCDKGIKRLVLKGIYI